MCLFCEIVSAQIPSSKVYEDEQILAFRDINPQAPIHVLIIPKEHIDSVDKINASNSPIIAHIFETIPKIAKELGADDGYRVITNIGNNGCQSVKHLHFHILGGKKLSEKMD